MEYKYCSNPNCKQQNPQPTSNFQKDSRKKDGLRSRCKECQKEATKAYNDAHREVRAEKQRLYYKEHGDIQRAASRNWKMNNKERNKEITDEWYRENKAKKSKYNYDYATNHHDGVLERSRKRRAISFGLDEHFTEKEFAKKLEEYGNKCCYCGVELTNENMTRDHYIPLTSGGNDTIDNIVPCCRDCNSKKRNRMPEEYFELLGNHEPSRTNGRK